jgi:hypothetical protein
VGDLDNTAFSTHKKDFRLHLSSSPVAVVGGGGGSGGGGGGGSGGSSHVVVGGGDGRSPVLVVGASGSGSRPPSTQPTSTESTDCNYDEPLAADTFFKRTIDNLTPRSRKTDVLKTISY